MRRRDGSLVPVPFSPAQVLLLGALPGVALLARAVAHAISLDRGLRTVLPVGLGLCLFLSAVHVASLVAGSLDVGLPAATLVLAAAGVVAEWRRRREGDDVAEGRRPPLAMWLAMAATAAMLAPAALRFWFHDELAFTGHMSIAASLQNGIYPPRHLAMPDLPLRYHYAFDLLTACLTALLRVPIDRAIDIATLLLWCASWCLLGGLGERIAGRAGAVFTPLLALLASGLPLGCDRPGSSPWDAVVLRCDVGDLSLGAASASYFFQHPWSVGIPVAATIALLLDERRAVRPAARLVALGLALAVLSLSEITLFAAMLPAVVVAEAWYAERLDRRRALMLLGVALVALGASVLAGGFFARVPGGEPLRFRLHAGVAGGGWDSLVWNAKTFGVLLPLGAAGFLARCRGRVLWALLAVGSIAVVNGVRYAETGDIVKFAEVASIALGVLGSVVLARLWTRGSLVLSTAAVGLALAATATSGAFMLAFALDVKALPPAMRRAPAEVPAEECDAMTFVRRRAHAGQLVYHAYRGSEAWAEWGGVATGQRSWTDGAFGLPGERLTARELMLQRPPEGVGELRAAGYAWLVVRDRDPFAPLVDGWILAGEAREDGRFGGLRVVQLSGVTR